MSDDLTQREIDDAAVLLIAVDRVLGDGMSLDHALEHSRGWTSRLDTTEPWTNGQHAGDCTGQPHSCARCHWETAQEDARWLYENDIQDVRLGRA